MVRVSIIILNWKGKEDTYECIKSIYKSSFKDFEIVLIDNNSADGSVEFFKSVLKGFKKIRLIENKINAGLAEGMNIGIRNAKANLICLLGNDTIVDKHWLSELVSAIESKKGLAIVGSKIKNLVGYGGKEICGVTTNVFFQAVDLPNNEEKMREHFDEITYPSLTSMIFKRDLFENNPFIAEYFGNYEDVYFSVLARLKGYKVEMNPKSYVLHIGGASVSKVPTLMDFHMEKNAILTFFIVYHAKTIVRLLPLFILYQIFVLLKSVFNRKILNKLNSYFWLIKNYSVVLKYRKVVKRQRKISDKELIKLCMSYKLPIKGFIGDICNELIRIYLFIVGIKTKDM